MGLWNYLTDKAHDLTGIPTEDEKRHQKKAMREQMEAYKSQTELNRQMINEKRNAEAAEKRRIEEKQIRSLRRNYRPPGAMLGGGATTGEGMSNKLGG